MAEENGEVTDSSAGDRTDIATKTCEYCGADIETNDWYPVTNERDEDGSLRLYHFCSQGCQDAWLDETRE